MTIMRSMLAGFWVLILGLLVVPAAVVADPCLIVYPTVPAMYHYDANEYYTVTLGHPLYDPMYDRGGEVLIEANTNEIAYNIYQIPYLIGFQESTGGKDGYFFIGPSFDLIIDGFNNAPTTYENIILVFEADPSACHLSITVGGTPVVGGSLPIGDLEVSTPTPSGNNYTDTITKHVQWSGCYGVRIWAFADQNYNGARDGGECFTAFSHDVTVPARNASWGSVKSLYR